MRKSNWIQIKSRGKKWQSYTENLSDESTKLAIPRKKGENWSSSTRQKSRGEERKLFHYDKKFQVDLAEGYALGTIFRRPVTSPCSVRSLCLLFLFWTVLTLFFLSLFLLFPFFPLSSVCFSFYICVSVYLSLSVYLCLLPSISFIDLLYPFSLPFSCFLFSSSFSTLYVTSD